jgi:hypothetical protein
MHTFWKLLAYRLTNTLVKEKKAVDTPVKEDGMALTEEGRQRVQDLGYTGDVELVKNYLAIEASAHGLRLHPGSISCPWTAHCRRRQAVNVKTTRERYPADPI